MWEFTTQNRLKKKKLIYFPTKPTKFQEADTRRKQSKRSLSDTKFPINNRKKLTWQHPNRIRRGRREVGQHSIRPAGQERTGCEIPGTKNPLFQFNQEGKGHGKWGVHLMYNDGTPTHQWRMRSNVRSRPSKLNPDPPESSQPKETQLVWVPPPLDTSAHAKRKKQHR